MLESSSKLLPSGIAEVCLLVSMVTYLEGTGLSRLEVDDEGWPVEVQGVHGSTEMPCDGLEELGNNGEEGMERLP